MSQEQKLILKSQRMRIFPGREENILERQMVSLGSHNTVCKVG
jgi:hypothetical protein